MMIMPKMLCLFYYLLTWGAERWAAELSPPPPLPPKDDPGFQPLVFCLYCRHSCYWARLILQALLLLSQAYIAGTLATEPGLYCRHSCYWARLILQALLLLNPESKHRDTDTRQTDRHDHYCCFANLAAKKIRVLCELIMYHWNVSEILRLLRLQILYKFQAIEIEPSLSQLTCEYVYWNWI